ncbi:MAG: DUF411 domain-containing protein [Gemmatimonadaceae bacterium]|nr:DUF411 domain-containing protein [Gemmatimonadaceae bacterium]
MVTRREWLRAALGGSAAALVTGVMPAFGGEAPIAITVYKTPSCGCCAKWVTHLRANGFDVTTRDMDDLSEVKATFGIPTALRSCHTATVGAYAIEGHVPASVIHRMLRERPKIAGLAAPGMPAGSPGMEMPGEPAGHFDVIAFERTGATHVYAKV